MQADVAIMFQRKEPCNHKEFKIKEPIGLGGGHTLETKKVTQLHHEQKIVGG